ncbi:hypothetical protein DV735_g5045, partial [Chaetothyriales sp. CBS 134920]
MSQVQQRAHAGHSHRHHGHSHGDASYLVSTNKSDAGARITRIGLLVNLAMAIGKGIGGYVFNSQALIADGFHALTDLVSDFMTLATISWSLKLPTDRFPYGYGKIESLGALGVSGLLLVGGLGMGLNSLSTLYTQVLVDASAHAHEHVHEHAHGLMSMLGHTHSHGGVPNLNAAWLAAASIVVKEWLYRATMKVARERKSSVLASNAIHHRIDSLTSIVALLTIGGAHLISDASWLDPVGGLIISVMVIRAGLGNTKASLLELADVSVDADVKEKVDHAVATALRGNVKKDLAGVQFGSEVGIRDITGIKSGQNYLIDIELSAPAALTLQQLHTIEDAVRLRVGNTVRGVRRIRVKFVPFSDDAIIPRSDFIPPDVSPRSSPEPQEEDGQAKADARCIGHVAGGQDEQKKLR